MANKSSHDSPSRDPSKTTDVSRVRSQSIDSLCDRETTIISPNSSLGNCPLESKSRATNLDVTWNCFDPEVAVLVTARNRPHWDQTGALTFVTIRLADSMPKAVVQRWLDEQMEWLRVRGYLPPKSEGRRKGKVERSGENGRRLDSESRATSHDSPSRDCSLSPSRDFSQTLDKIHTQLPEHLRRAFLKFKNQRWHESLDNCHGRCVLRHVENARVVADSLLRFDTERYDIERFVIMPNHVHMLVQMRAGWLLRKQCESWMRFTGRQINTQNLSVGEFWAEPFDHIVRNEAQFDSFRIYIVENPAKAKLIEGEYLLWIRGTGFSSIRCLSRESR